MVQESIRSKGPLKEKFVEITEALFRGETPFANDPQTFWDVYFLLPINTKCLTDQISCASGEDLFNRRAAIRQLFRACVDRLRLQTSKSEQTRQSQCALFLAVLFRNLFLKKRLSNENVIHILTDLDKAHDIFHDLIQTLTLLISSRLTRSIALTLALALAAGNDNVNENNLNGYFMDCQDLPKALLSAIADDTAMDNQQGAVFLFCLLSNFDISRNPYLLHLSSCKDKVLLERISVLFTQLFGELTSEYAKLKDDEENWTKAAVSYLSRWFPGASSSGSSASTSDTISTEDLAGLPPSPSSLLLFLYDLINNNPYFVAVILPKASNNPSREPPRLLTSLLAFASYLFQHNRNHRSFMYTKLMSLILLRLAENSAVLDFMAKDDSDVRLCRQRYPPLPRAKKPWPLLCVILDNTLLFVKHNMRKKLDMSTYNIIFLIIEHVVAYLNKHSLRLEYHWTEMWPTLTAFLHFMVVHLTDLRENEHFRGLIKSFMNVVNGCVMHCDRFVQDDKSYDALYYEVIRATDDFKTLEENCDLAASNAPLDTGLQRSVGTSSALSSLVFANIGMIRDHFQPALDEMSQKSKFSNPEQVMVVIRDRYNSFKPDRMAKLDAIGSHTPISAERGYFNQLLRVIVSDYMGKRVRL